MALTKTELKRKFVYKGKELPDIEGLSPREVGKAYAGTYPELINSTFEYKGIENDTEIYEVSSKAGIKG